MAGKTIGMRKKSERAVKEEKIVIRFGWQRGEREMGSFKGSEG